MAENILENGTYQFNSLWPVSRGISGTYCLLDHKNTPLFIIKPFDEEAGCINNPKSWAGLTEYNPVRWDITLYHSAMREALAYQVALEIGVSVIAPVTVLAIIQSNQFRDYIDKIPLSEAAYYLQCCGPVDREKLCSVQQYVPNSKAIYETIMDLEARGLIGPEIAKRFDQEDFENANILVWTTGDTDGHLGNFLAYPKKIDELGNEIFGIKKIDNGLAFPDRNRQFRNYLDYLENANLPLSDAAKEKIAKIDIEVLIEQFKIYGLESAVPALRERIPYLQELAKQPGVTINQINTAISVIEVNV